MFKLWLNRYRRALITSLILACLITPALAAVIRDYRIGDALHAGNLLIGDGSSNYVTIKQPALSADYNFPLPTSDGTNGQVLTTNGAGTASSWTSVSGFGVTTFADTALPYASATDTFSFDATNYAFVDTANAEYLLLGSGTGPGTIKFLEGSGTGTNKLTLTVPTSLSDVTVTLPAATDTLVGKATTDELTNKTVTAGVVKDGLTASGSASNDFSASTGTFKTSTGVNTLGGECDLVAGTTAIAPVKFTSGTNLTTATAGAFEYDGKCFYDTAVAATRQVIPGMQYLAINSPYTLTDATTQQALFGASNNSIGLAAATTYVFECDFTISSMSATSGNCKFSPAGIGASGATATILSCTYTVTGLDATTLGTAAATSECTTATTTADPITTGDCVVASTGTAVHVHAQGLIRINAAGTIIPSISLTTGSVTPAVAINSWFVIYPVGNGTVTAVGKIA